MRRIEASLRVLLVAGICVLAMACLAQAALPEGLVAYYKFDATSGMVAVDETGAHDGTLTGALAWVEGKEGNALEFRGGTGSPFVNLGAWQTDGPAGLGLAVWFKWAGTNSVYQGLISQRDGTMYWWTELSPDGGELRFKSNTSPQSNLIVPGNQLVPGEWTHYACSHDAAAGTGVVYLNGEQTVSGSWSLPEGDFSGLRTGIGVVNTADGLGTFYGLMDEAMIFNRPLSVEDVAGAMEGFGEEVASGPVPKDGATDVPRDVVLTWRPSQTAIAHDVYFGTSADDVSNADRANPGSVLVGQGQDPNTYDPDGMLEFSQTYFWRIDEVNAPPTNSIFPGAVWSFTTEPFAYPVEGIAVTTNTMTNGSQVPENVVNGSGLNADDQHSTEQIDMWAGTAPAGEVPYIRFDFDKVYKLHEMLVWNYNLGFEMFLGIGLKDVLIEYSEDGENWTVLGDVVFAQGPGASDYTANTQVSFEGATASHVRLTVNSAYGNSGMIGLSEVRFMYIPVLPREPQPADGSTNLAINTTLSWRGGREAASHEIYLGTDPNAMAMAGSTTESRYNPDLDLDTTYSWQIVEVNEAEMPPAWAGDIWTFTTQEYIEVEGFETYNDDIEAGTVIWQSWIDGIDDSTNGGGVVGYGQSPFAEETIVRSGLQSMPFSFENDSASAISEADRTLSPAQDWTTNGIKTLSLWFYGAAGNVGQLYVKINGTKVLYDGAATDIANPLWQAWNIDLTGMNVSHVTTLTLGVQGTGSGMIFVDDIRLYAKAAETIMPVEPEMASLVGRWAFDGDLTDGSGHGHNGTMIGDGITFANDTTRGQVLSLPGGDDIYVSIGSVGISGTMPRTIACWAKADNTEIPDWSLIFGFTGTDTGEGGNGSHFNIGSLGGPGGVGVHCWGWEETIFSDEEALEWHHYAMSYDGTTIRYYGDGRPMDTDPAKSNVQDLSISADRVHVGSRITQTSSFPGRVDDAVIYNVQLTDGEVAWIAGRRAPLYESF